MEKKEVRNCEVCGTPFVVNRPQRKTCSKECAYIKCKKRKTEYDRKKKEESKKIGRKLAQTQILEDDARRAKELGMSYGKYKEMQFRENMRWRNEKK